MTTIHTPTQPQGTSAPSDSYVEPGGWLVFASIMLMVGGVMRFFDSMWAFFYKGSVPDNLQSALLGHDLSTYGWLWLGVSIILFASGLGVLTRSQISRWIGIAAGGLASISAIWWMPYYPIWALTYIAIGMLVLYGLAAHGGRAS